MFLRTQDFDFFQILSNFPKSDHFCPNLIKFVKKKFCYGDGVASPDPHVITAYTYESCISYAGCTMLNVAIIPD